MERLPKSGTKRKASSQGMEVTPAEQAVEEEAIATKTSTAASKGKSPLSFSGNVTKEAGENSISFGLLIRDCIADAAAKVGPAVVNLFFPKGHWKYPNETISCSGIIIDADGTIVTCAFVTDEQLLVRPVTCNKVEVTLQDGRYFEGEVVLVDVHSDVAIVKIKSELPLPVAKLGSSSKLRPGNWVISLGCPSALVNNVTSGIVSVDLNSIDLDLEGMYRDFLQNDCTVNKGNSGGGLANIDGDIVGLNTIKFLGTFGNDFTIPIGMHFAVPSDSVLKIVGNFNQNGRVVRPWIGLRILHLNGRLIAEIKEGHPNFPNVKQGILVSEVNRNSPAEFAGLRNRDIITELNGIAVKSSKEIVEIMEIGKSFEVGVIRENASENASELSFTVIPEELDPKFVEWYCGTHI